ncbi:thiaminase II [Amycolatopsis acidicola]|uniref:Aminopyrimidine aminohydrolase n=1 Tax=Amycolatopsis acidicola TaxID=2596893 RepID=A0A5N0UK89_9PSEU|nr:thiaminase II [Amycolatopsis acidicola]KAA9149827.1 thiaminase II [Amycolatopsis acidicola]
MALSEQLRSAADEIWQAQHAHPFVRGLGDGSLEPERFRFWIRQDYVFLVEYARLLALAAARSPDLETMTRFAGLLHETLNEEMALHRSYSAELGIDPGALEREEPAPTTRGYADFLLRSAAVGDFAELLVALLPCMWGFNEIGLRLAADGAHDRYASWVRMYSSAEFGDLVGWLRELTDRYTWSAGLERVFLASSRYELAFWEMAWQQESWPSLTQPGG